MRTEAGPPSVGDGGRPTRGQPPASRWSRSPQVNWLLALSVLLIAAALVLSFVLAGPASPTLAVDEPAVAGQTVHLVGRDFPAARRVRFQWDGTTQPWLDTARTDRDGTLEQIVVLPESLEPGRHRIDGIDATDGALLASVIVTIQASPTVPATGGRPTSSPSPSPVATPTSAPTPSPVPTPSAATPSPIPSVGPGGPVAGYGAATQGGRGGTILVVSTLDDSGPGSLRAALEADGARIIAFAVGGTIALANDIVIRSPDVTVAGETAPTPIVVRGGAIKVSTHDVVVRHLRLRPGDDTRNPADTDALTLNGLTTPVFNVVLDHLTMIWGPDIGGLAILGDVHDVTVQNSIMGEGLYLSRHPEAVAAQGGHSMALNATQLDAGTAWPQRITLHHNLFTTSNARMPRFQGAECVDLVNNVIYNWGQDSAHGNPRSLNVVNNWYRAGPETSRYTIWRSQPSDVNPRLFDESTYLSGNAADGFSATTDAPPATLANRLRCGRLSVQATSAETAYSVVLDSVGATLPVRDGVDERIILNVVLRAGRFFNGNGEPAPNPYWL